MTDPKNVTAIILAGGKSTRMGSDKGLIEFNGRKMIEAVIGRIKNSVDNILIVSNNPLYGTLGYNVVGDSYKDCGPVAGIHAGLLASSTAWNFVAGCDMPFIDAGILSLLSEKAAEQQAVIPVHDGKVEPLCGFYNKSAARQLESFILARQLKMQLVVKLLNTLFVEVPKEKFDSNVVFRNINTPEEKLTR